LQEEATSLKDKCDHYKLKEDKLRTMKQKLDMIDKLNNNGDDDDNSVSKETLISDV
jgi:hypothetical protein